MTFYSGPESSVRIAGAAVDRAFRPKLLQRLFTLSQLAEQAGVFQIEFTGGQTLAGQEIWDAGIFLNGATGEILRPVAAEIANFDHGSWDYCSRGSIIRFLIDGGGTKGGAYLTWASGRRKCR